MEGRSQASPVRQRAQATGAGRPAGPAQDVRGRRGASAAAGTGRGTKPLRENRLSLNRKNMEKNLGGRSSAVLEYLVL